MKSKYKQKKLVDKLYKYREDKLSKLKMQLIRTITDITDSRLDKTALEKTLLEQMIKIISEALTDKEQTEFDKLFDLFVAEKDKSEQLLLALKDKKVQTYADYHTTIFKSLDTWLRHNGYTEEMINDVYEMKNKAETIEEHYKKNVNSKK